MPYYIECANCHHWKGMTKEYNGVTLHFHSGTCWNEQSEKCGSKTYDTNCCDWFELKEE